MTGCKRVFVDTAPLIYFLDDSESFGERVKGIFENCISWGVVMVTSVVTCHEYLVYPYRTNNHKKVQALFDFTNDFDIDILNTNLEVAKKAAKIRAEHTDLKGMDSLQLATAIVYDCDLFLTNDRQLCKIREINCVTVDEWEG